MMLQSLLVVVLRLIALNFLLQCVSLFASIFVMQSDRLSLNKSAADLPWFVLGSLIVVAILLWFLALPIAKSVTHGVSSELSFGAMSLVDCYSIAFMGAGLFYMCGHLAPTLNWTYYLFTAAASRPGDTWKQGVPWYEVTKAIIPFGVGIVLFVKGREWAVALAQKDAARAALASPVDGKNEK
jgi:hypothetical protein